MRDLPFASALACLLTLSCFGCLSSSSGTNGPAAPSDAGSDGACSPSILAYCLNADGTCWEFTGEPNENVSDPYGCVQSGGTLAHGGACVHTGTLGSCVAPAGIAVEGHMGCDDTLTTWLPQGYDSGVAGQECAKVSGTFAPN